jgi:hypothetical protein
VTSLPVLSGVRHEHVTSLPVLSGVRCVQSLVFYVVIFISLFVHLSLFLLRTKLPYFVIKKRLKI